MASEKVIVIDDKFVASQVFQSKSILIKQVIVCLSVRLWAAKPQGLTG